MRRNHLDRRNDMRRNHRIKYRVEPPKNDKIDLNDIGIRAFEGRKI